eukprot:CAMPEP_0181531998 /NCGR_PEP_ID=MMETSP1110-20121109/72389_1 /TAXON_ID=174948 /ORGANISM="Symbiodinium sp., Strain CCMP421" /LENGTH=586 /DNA_ID=CAMNT_0023663085 /DNA_START=90 /DNA_END=1852 /DNA_ORIENTATION=-
MASPVFHAMFFGLWQKEAVPRRRMDFELSGNHASSAPTSPRSHETEPLDRFSSHAWTTGQQFRRGQHHYVAVSDVEPSAFKCMLRYVHHLDPMLSLDNAMQVYRAADKYQIDGLLESCGAFIEKHVDPSNVMQVLGLFDVAFQELLEILGELSRVQTRQVLHAQEFLELHTASLATLLSFDGLCIDEERLWRALRSWAELRAKYKEQPEPVLEGTGSSGGRKSASVAPSELVPSWQDAIRPLRHLIRFPALSAAFFAKEISKSGVLSHQEVVDIFCFLARKQVHQVSPPSIAEHADSDVRIGGIYRADCRVPRLGWCLAPGQSDPMLGEEFGLTEGRELMSRVGSLIVDGRGLSTAAWGSNVILAGPGTGFHLAFGNMGFTSGRHAWTISWRPMDSLQPGLGRTRCSRGGAAGIARDISELVERTTSSSAVFGSTGGTTAAGPALVAKSAVAAAPPLNRTGPVALPTSLAAGAGSGAGTEEPSARFLDWTSCIVFGVKREVATEGRYVAWEEDLSSTDLIRFSIVLDFPSAQSRILQTAVEDAGQLLFHMKVLSILSLQPPDLTSSPSSTAATFDGLNLASAFLYN